MTAVEDYPYKIDRQANTESATSDAEEDEVEEQATPIKPWKAPHIPADKPVFTLSVAADLLGLHPRTLRIYEEKQLVVPARTGGNRRCYSPNDIDRFHSIRKLTGGGVNLEGVRIILDMADELTKLGGDPTELIERNLAPRTTDDGR
jgi:MerR family transcriptional regulator, heat shock protein HspR